MKRIKLDTALRDVQEVLDPSARLELVRSTLERATRDKTRFATEETELTRTTNKLEFHPGADLRSRLQATALRTLGALLLVLDVPLQAAIGIGVFTWVAPMSWLVLAPAIALGSAALVHAGTVSFLHDSQRPARSLRTIRALASITLFAVLVGGSVLLFSRTVNAETAGSILGLSGAAIWLLAESLPLGAGFLTAWAYVLGEPRRFTERLAEVREEQQSLDRLVRSLLTEEERVLSRMPGLARAVAPVLLALLLAMPAMAGGQSPSVTPARVCAIAVDRTASVDSAALSKTLTEIERGMRIFVERAGCTGLLVTVFSDEGPFAPRSYHDLPQGSGSDDCSRSPPVALVGTARMLAGVAGFQQYAVAEGRRRCIARRASDSANTTTAWTRLADAVRNTLHQPGAAPSVRTDILGVLEGLAESRVVATLLVTDGVATTRRVAGATASWSKAHPIVLLVPSRAEFGGMAAARAAGAEWRARGVSVYPFTVLVSPAQWLQIAGEVGS